MILCTFLYGIFLFGCQEKRANPDGDLGARPVNILYIMADDLGYGDVSCYGGEGVETPNIDALARAGMKATKCYAGAAVCTPSRACVLTGNYPLRFGIRKHFEDKDEHLPANVRTLPRLLKSVGYATAHVGKWHLGGVRQVDIDARKEGKMANPGPMQHGFDHYLASIEDTATRHKLVYELKSLYREGGKYQFRDDANAEPSEQHITDLQTDEAIRLMRQFQEAGKPFYLNLWYDAPHTPYEPAPEPHLSRYAQRGTTGDQLLFRSMVSHLDTNVGRLVSFLKESGLYENTLIVFTSDNGPAYQGVPGAFKGGKTDLHEGGLRVPFIAVWEGHIPAASLMPYPMHFADLLPTFCEVAGIHQIGQSIDGKSQWAQWQHPDQQPGGERLLLWQQDIYPKMQQPLPKPEPYATLVARKGKWKLLATPEQPLELFDLETDPREIHNLLVDEPALVEGLMQEIRIFYEAPRHSWDE